MNALKKLQAEVRELRAENALLKMQLAPGITARCTLARIAKVIELLRLGGQNATLLAREMNVSTKTIQRDLDFIRGPLRLPLVFDSRKNQYEFPHGVSFDWFNRAGRAATSRDDLVTLLQKFHRRKP